MWIINQLAKKFSELRLDLQYHKAGFSEIFFKWEGEKDGGREKEGREKG